MLHHDDGGGGNSTCPSEDLMAMLYVLNAGWDSAAADATALENMNTTGEVQDRRPSPLHASRTELEEERKRTYLLCVSI